MQLDLEDIVTPLSNFTALIKRYLCAITPLLYQAKYCINSNIRGQSDIWNLLDFMLEVVLRLLPRA